MSYILTKEDMKNKSPLEIKRILDDAWLNIHVDEEHLYNPLLDMPDHMRDTPHLYYTWLMMQPEYFSFVCEELLNLKLLPTQALMLSEMWNRKFPMLIASRGFGKSFMLAVYAILRALFMPNRKIVICGAAYRQSKVIYEYIVGLYNNSPLFTDIVGSNASRNLQDMMRFTVKDSTISALPIGDGQKIRGQRANDIIADEFASISRDIFENVIAGFGVVSSSPAAMVQDVAARALAERLGVTDQLEEKDEYRTVENQIIFSGTAYYDFNHFAEYWKKWKAIINSQGDPKKLTHVFNDIDEVPKNFKWTDYSIFRIPFELVPEGFMDAGQVARSRATIHSGIYEMEFGAVFSTDSNGFFKRSLIETCVCSDSDPVMVNNKEVRFSARLEGSPDKKYVYGVDPASEADNFSIIIVEIHPDHRRIVYCWTTNRNDHKEKVKRKLVKETDFYSYCARKIRDLMKVFPCEAIALDSQGGGYAILEALHDKDKYVVDDGERPIWETIDPTKEKDTDGNSGLHIVELINFASADWTRDANNFMRKDLEDKAILFPLFNAAELAYSGATDSALDKIFDTLEDCVMDIEELKDELSTIVITQTANGRDRWDTPEIKLPGGKKGRQRKDRYSSIIMANMVARTIARAEVRPIYEGRGGFAQQIKNIDRTNDFSGPAWFTEKMNGLYDEGV